MFLKDKGQQWQWIDSQPVRGCPAVVVHSTARGLKCKSVMEEC